MWARLSGGPGKTLNSRLDPFGVSLSAFPRRLNGYIRTQEPAHHWVIDSASGPVRLQQPPGLVEAD